MEKQEETRWNASNGTEIVSVGAREFFHARRGGNTRRWDPLKSAEELERGEQEESANEEGAKRFWRG